MGWFWVVLPGDVCSFVGIRDRYNVRRTCWVFLRTQKRKVLGCGDWREEGTGERKEDNSQVNSNTYLDILEGPSLLAVAVDGNGLSLECLDDEVAHHAAVVGVHTRAKSVENARDSHLQTALCVRVKVLLFA